MDNVKHHVKQICSMRKMMVYIIAKKIVNYSNSMIQVNILQLISVLINAQKVNHILMQADIVT